MVDAHTDSKFECLKTDLLLTILNLTAADVHVGDVERSIWKVKEGTGTTILGLPFNCIPILMVQALVENSNSTLNMFPSANGLSDITSPLTILTGQTPPDYNKLRLEFGTYVQVFEDKEPTNTMATRNVGAIALNPTGNAQGDYYFMSLVTGQ